MNLIEALKQIGRDIKALVTRTDSIEKSIEELKKTSTSSSTSTTSTDLEQIKQDINDLKSLKWFKDSNSWSNYGSDKPRVWKELEEATGDVGTPNMNLPFYFFKDKEGGAITLYGLDNPPFYIDPETKEVAWRGDYEWIDSITAENLLGFELRPVPENIWGMYDNGKNKGEGRERDLVARTFGDTKQQGLWYVDDDGHFQRLVDTVIELKKEIEELKGNQNHE
ncbi:hypothetical protein O3632_03755 [Streptococcus parasanguinis]|uniref:hypothetical protein n=1 Tax=Streptococcus parasanguinis TaxID=1318 RepID=UPI00352CB231